MISVQDGQTALYLASKKGFGGVVELLLEKEQTDVSISTKVCMYDMNTTIPLAVYQVQAQH